MGSCNMSQTQIILSHIFEPKLKQIFFFIYLPPWEKWRERCGTVGPRPFGYCSVAMTGTSSNLAT